MFTESLVAALAEVNVDREEGRREGGRDESLREQGDPVPLGGEWREDRNREKNIKSFGGLEERERGRKERQVARGSSKLKSRD